MNKSVILAIFFTILLIITYIGAALYILYVLKFSLWGLKFADCTLKMAFAGNNCMCINLEDPSKCSPIGQKWLNSPDECKTCPPTNIPVGYYIVNNLFGIMLLLTILAWINVFTKTVKF